MKRPGSLVLIPARAGSKRLRDKMLRRLDGKTLVEWAVDAVTASQCFERVIVSSDSQAILEPIIGRSGVEARVRPAELATDTATTMQVLLDLLQSPDRHPLASSEMSASSATTPSDASLVALCQPTTPFRTGDDVTKTVALIDRGFDTAIAVMAAPIPPQRSFPIDAAGECLIGEDSPLRKGKTRKQLFDETYTPNGAVYVATRRHVLERGSFFSGRVGAHVMPRERSLDIDDEFDWQMAEVLLRHR